MNLREIETSLENTGEELGFDSRAVVSGTHNARTVVQENEAGMTCEDENGIQHSFSFWVDPRFVTD